MTATARQKWHKCQVNRKSASQPQQHEEDDEERKERRRRENTEPQIQHYYYVMWPTCKRAIASNWHDTRYHVIVHTQIYANERKKRSRRKTKRSKKEKTPLPIPLTYYDEHLFQLWTWMEKIERKLENKKSRAQTHSFFFLLFFFFFFF